MFQAGPLRWGCSGMHPGNWIHKSSTHHHHLCENHLPVPGSPLTDNIFLKNLIRISYLHYFFPYHWALLERASVLFRLSCQGAENRSVPFLMFLKLTKALLNHCIFQLPDCTDKLSYIKALLVLGSPRLDTAKGTPNGSHGLYVEKTLQWIHFSFYRSNLVYL